MAQEKENALEKYIQTQEKAWLEEFSPFISNSRILKIGNGLGHLSERIRPFAKELVILDIQTYPKTINKESVQIYDGHSIPYPDKSFDTSVVIFTLHHIPHSTDYFQEILRVTENRIILLEETYTNVFSKIHLYYRDWTVNKKAQQPCKLYWNSYFSRKRLNRLVTDNNLKEVYRFTKRHKTYFKELLVLDVLPRDPQSSS
jgi:ubiquinone/menaquinone biosynthesis C-methylase UbiE